MQEELETIRNIEFLNDPIIVDALRRALDRGVKVKIYIGKENKKNKK